MSALGPRSEESVGQSKPAASSTDSESNFEAWLAKTAVLGRVEGFGKDERRRNSKAREAGRRQSQQNNSAETKKLRSKSWINRLSGL